MKLAGPSALVACATALALVPGTAKAQVNTVADYSCTVFGSLDNTNCAIPVQLGDKKLTSRPDLFSFSSSEPGTRDLSIRYSWLENGDGVADNDFSNDGWLFEVKAPDGSDAFGGPFVLSYGYDVEIVDGLSGPQGGTPPPAQISCGTNCDFVADGDPWYFNRVRLEVDANQPFDGIAQVTKFTTAEGQVFELNSENGQAENGVQFFTLPFDTKKITIQDTITLNSSAVITSVTNSWNQRTSKVPGPVPVLGAGAAFGFSRRIRKRISLSRFA